MEISRQRRPSIRMEMSPLIDCVFLLLIFFMLSSTFLAPKIRLDLPPAALAPDTAQNDSVLIAIDAEGDVFVNGEPLSWEQVSDRLRQLLEGREPKAVSVRCDQTAPHRYFVRVLEAARACGAEHIHVAYQQRVVEGLDEGP